MTPIPKDGFSNSGPRAGAWPVSPSGSRPPSAPWWTGIARSNSRFQPRAIEFEALREKILATRAGVNPPQQELDRREAELAKRTVEYVSTENLYRLSALLRGEIRKVFEAASGEEAMACGQ